MRGITRIRDMDGVEDQPRINMPALKKAIVDATGDGKPWSRNSLSLAASGGRSRDLVRDIMRSKSREPALPSVAGIAAALDRPISDFIVGRRGPARSGSIAVEIGAAVQAGVWRESHAWPPDERYTVKFDEEEDVEGDIIGLRAEGRSMDKIFPPGTDLQVVKLIGSNVLVQDGDYVVVERCQGSLCEQTVKRLRIREDGNYELVAESYLPEFEEPLFFGKPNEDFVGDNEIRIVGVVLNAKRSFFRNRRKVPISS